MVFICNIMWLYTQPYNVNGPTTNQKIIKNKIVILIKYYINYKSFFMFFINKDKLLRADDSSTQEAELAQKTDADQMATLQTRLSRPSPNHNSTDAAEASAEDDAKEAEMTREMDYTTEASAEDDAEKEVNEDEEEMANPMADLPAATAQTMEQAQRARHDAGISSGAMDSAVAGTSAAASWAMPSVPLSATHRSLATAKQQLAEAAGDRKSVV